MNGIFRDLRVTPATFQDLAFPFLSSLTWFPPSVLSWGLEAEQGSGLQPCLLLTLPEILFIRLFTVMKVAFTCRTLLFKSSIIATFILGVLILFYRDRPAPTLGFKFFEAVPVFKHLCFPLRVTLGLVRTTDHWGRTLAPTLSLLILESPGAPVWAWPGQPDWRSYGILSFPPTMFFISKLHPDSFLLPFAVSFHTDCPCFSFLSSLIYLLAHKAHSLSHFFCLPILFHFSQIWFFLPAPSPLSASGMESGNASRNVLTNGGGLGFNMEW